MDFYFREMNQLWLFTAYLTAFTLLLVLVQPEKKRK
jgi:hypothetical protein